MNSQPDKEVHRTYIGQDLKGSRVQGLPSPWMGVHNLLARGWMDLPTWKFSQLHRLEFLWRFPYAAMVGQSLPSM